VQLGESTGGVEAPGRAGQGGAPTMDGLAKLDLRIDEREESGPRRQVAAIFQGLRLCPAVYERG